MQKIILIFTLLFSSFTFGQKQCDTLFIKADKFIDNDELDRAIEIFTSIINKKCNDSILVKAYNGRGMTYNYQKNYEKALLDFDNAIKIDKHNAVAYANKAATYSYQEKYIDAIQLLTQAINLSPDYIFYKMRADCEVGAEQTEKAIFDYEACIKLNHSYVDAYDGLSYVYKTQKKFDKAETVINDLLKNNPNKPELILFRAVFYRETEEYEKAIKDYSISFRYDSTHPKMLYNFGYCYEMTGDLHKAIDLYSKALKFKKDVNVFWARGYLYKKTNQFKLAIQDMQAVLDFEPNRAQAYLIIGNSYSELGEKEKAIQAYKKGLTLNPKYNTKTLLELGLKKFE
jgi:tetratricopeptide (TPR) repeat protein